MLLCSGRSNPGANSWLAEDHIVLVDAEQLVVDFEAAWEELGGSPERPRGIHFISGPSSTADIQAQMPYWIYSRNPSTLKLKEISHTE